jgi:hypothetical protein
MAMKIATWLASVNEAGSRRIFMGENMGMIIPIAINKPDNVNLKMYLLLMKKSFLNIL